MLPKIRLGLKDWPPLERVPTDPQEWKELKKGSTKGFIILLVSLSWWEAKSTTKKDKMMVSSALKDILFVVRQLAAQVSDDTSVLHKRARGPESSLPPNKR